MIVNLAAWALGNVADEEWIRDLVVKHEDFLDFLCQLKKNDNLSVRSALGALPTLVHSNDDLVNAHGTLFYLSESTLNNNIQDIIDTDVCQRLVYLLKWDNSTQDVNDAGLISALVNLLHNQEIDLAIKYVVISVVLDVFANGTDEQIKVSVVEEKCIEPMC
ncbi:hypothetical protein HAX54_017251 [Datura stramonium]|uniref:Uncharacterized protein n=1 Tax=Datura stramonium TaxID=4076 RepID=A0ABS8ULM0_DATST|nr:hypothetical protein [Datura stramonium]